MAVISVAEDWKRRGSFEIKRGKRTYVRNFVVLTNNQLDGPATIMNALGAPVLFSTYTDPNLFPDVGARCVKLEPIQRTESPFVWDLRAYYDSDAERPQEGDINPILRPAKITYGMTQFQRPLQNDLDGLSILNSAGQPFSPPVQIDDSRPTISVVKNLAVFDQTLPLTYKDAVNSDAFFGYNPGVVKVNSIGGHDDYQNGQYFWETQWEFHIKLEGWQLSILDTGFQQILPQTTSAATIAIGSVVVTPASMVGIYAPVVGGVPGTTLLIDTGAKLEQVTVTATTATTFTATFAINHNVAPVKIQGVNLVNITGNDGRPVTTPVCLDGKGQQLKGVGTLNPPVYLSFKAYNSLPFAALPIP